MPTFQLTDWTQPIHQVVMPLIAIRNGRDENVWGSAFIIGRGWAVTAFHVLKDLVEHYEGPQRSWRNVSIGFEILGYLSLDAGTRFLPLKVLRAWRAEPLDIAVLAVGVPSDWPNDHVWGVPALDLLPPPVGTPIAGFGFAAGRVTRDQEGSIPRLSIDPMTATGEVLEIHHKLRDSARLPFPCYRTDARFDGGMSGGPVINNVTGRVCGVICSSLPATRDDEEHISYASSLWPVVGTFVDATDKALAGAPPYPLMRLFHNRVLIGDNAERVGVKERDDGTLQPYAHYDASQWDSPARVRQNSPNEVERKRAR